MKTNRKIEKHSTGENIQYLKNRQRQKTDINRKGKTERLNKYTETNKMNKMKNV
jgi:hypothetical protein